jgi:hypothetical protein
MELTALQLLPRLHKPTLTPLQLHLLLIPQQTLPRSLQLRKK